MSLRGKNVHGALANVHEWSPSLLSPSFIEQVARDGSSSSLNSNIIVHVQVKFADLKFAVIARCTGQANMHTQSEMKSR